MVILLLTVLSISADETKIPAGSVASEMKPPTEINSDTPARTKRHFLVGLLLGSLIGGHHHYDYYHHHHHRPYYYGGYTGYGHRYKLLLSLIW